nr:retrovirus-related Pol polyprotein from transposon TNT 1-94 [Tanacetum cinerariifolium]
MALGYQNPFYLKKAQKKQQSLYYGKVLLDKHDPPVVHDSEETPQLVQESRDKMKKINKEIKPANYTKINHLSGVFVLQTALSREELYFSNNSKMANVSKSFLIPNEDLSDDTTPSVARKFLNEEAAKFVGDFKSLANEADASLAKHKALELEIERLLKAVFSQDIMIIVQNESVVDTSDLQTEFEPYKDMRQKIERLQAQLGDLKGKSKDTSSISDTRNPMSQKLENENVELEFQDTSKNTKFANKPIVKNLSKVGKTNALSKPVTSNSVSSPQESKGVNKDKVIAQEMFRINPSKTSREEKQVPNTVSASAMTKPITVSQPPVITKKDACNNSKIDSQDVISKVVCAKCKKCLISVNHDECVCNYVNGKISRGKKQKDKFSFKETQMKYQSKVIQICLWCVDSGCSKHMTGNLKLLINFIWKFMGTVRFGNDHVAAIMGFGDLQWGNILITRVYFIEGLGHNLFSIGQFCDSDLEVAFRRDACFVRNLKGVDLLKGARSTNLYTINLHEMAYASPICLMAHASSTKSWLWHQWLSHLNFDTINDLTRNDLVAGLPKFKYHKEHICPSCEQGKSKRTSHPPKPVPNSRQRLHLLHMDLCGPMRIVSINGKRYVSVIVDDYSRYTWSPVIIIRTNNGTEFKNQVLKEYFDTVGISHQMSSVQTPQQNGVVERRNRTLVEAARTMLIFSRAPLLLLAEAISTACFTQNRSIIHLCFNKTPYELINGRKPDISFLYIFGALCYPKNDREDIGKLGAKGDIGFFIGYSADSCAYRVYNPTARTVPPAQEPQVRQSSTASTTIADTAPIPTNSSSLATNIPITSQDVDELNPNAMIDSNTFVNPFANSSTSAAATSSQQNVDPSNMHTNQLRSDGDMCMYALSVSTMEPKNVKKAMTDPAWIDSMQEELLQFKRLDVWVLVPAPDNISPLTLKWLFKNKHDKEQTVIRNKSRLVVRGYRQDVSNGRENCISAWIAERRRSKYVLEILNKYGMESCDPVGTPVEIKDKLDLDQNGTPVDATKYRSMIGALMYLTSGRLDIDSGFELTGFSDADYTGCKDTFKSASGGAQFLGLKMVSWSSKKQDCTGLSTAKGEYVSLSACCAQVLWMRK